MKNVKIIIAGLIGLVVGICLTILFMSIASSSNSMAHYDRIVLEQRDYTSGPYVEVNEIGHEASSAVKYSYIRELEEWNIDRSNNSNVRLPIDVSQVDWHKLEDAELWSYGELQSVEYASIADNILNYYDLEDEYPLNYTDALETVKKIEREDSFGNISDCLLALRLHKRTRCSSKKKFVKIIARKTNYGGVKYDKKGPTTAVFKNQVNRLNVLIEMLYRKRENYCSLKEHCDPWMKVCLCTKEPSEIQEEVCRGCNSEILKSLSSETLENLLSKVAASLEKFEREKVNAESVEAVMKAELNQLELDLSKEGDKEDSTGKTDTIVTPTSDTMSTSTSSGN